MSSNKEYDRMYDQYGIDYFISNRMYDALAYYIESGKISDHELKNLMVYPISVGLLISSGDDRFNDILINHIEGISIVHMMNAMELVEDVDSFYSVLKFLHKMSFETDYLETMEDDLYIVYILFNIVNRSYSEDKLKMLYDYIYNIFVKHFKSGSYRLTGYIKDIDQIVYSIFYFGYYHNEYEYSYRLLDYVYNKLLGDYIAYNALRHVTLLMTSSVIFYERYNKDYGEGDLYPVLERVYDIVKVKYLKLFNSFNNQNAVSHVLYSLFYYLYLSGFNIFIYKLLV
jgi:hypothetical protein